jgi:hypothetical protein
MPEVNESNTPYLILDANACVYFLKQLMLGHKASAIRNCLITAGHSARQADRIMYHAVKYRQEHHGEDFERLASGLYDEVRDLPNPMPLQVDEVPKEMDLINHVAQCLAMGCDPLDVQKQLMSFGFTAPNAEKYVADTTEWMRRNTDAGKLEDLTTGKGKSRINGNMLIGAAICIAGIVITIVTFSYAAKIGGGTYIVAWGAILFGALQFLKGAAQAGQELDAEQGGDRTSQNGKP